MKKIFKKINIFNLFSLLVILFIVSNVFVKANEKDYFELNEAGYYVEETTEEFDLGYGVTYNRDTAYLATFNKSKIKGNAAGAGGGGTAEINKFYAQQINKLEISSLKDAKLVPYAVLSGTNWSTSSVRNAAKDYEDNNPGWRVIAAINGDFFKIKESVKASTGVTVSQGEFYKAVSNHAGVNTLAIRNTDSGKQLFSTTVSKSIPVLTIYNDEGEIVAKYNINKVNEEPNDNEISLYYNTKVENFSSSTNFVTCKNVLLINNPSCSVTTVSGSYYGKGKISENITSEITLKNSQFALKCLNDEINSYLNINTNVRVQYEYVDESLNGIYNFIGFPCSLINNGNPESTEYLMTKGDDLINYRHPRTMIGQKEDGTIIMAVVDGRQPNKNMYGATAYEMQALMGYYGCVDAWNLDGGGSTTLIIRKQANVILENSYNDRDDNSWYVTNSPSDSSERSDGNCLLVVVKVPEAEITIDNILSDSITINVVLLTELEKYKDLYLLLNGEMLPVVNGKVTFSQLDPHTDYVAYLYYKDGEQYNYLLYSYNVNTAYENPCNLKMNYSIVQKNDETLYVFKFNLDNMETIKRISITVNNKTYNTTNGSLTIEPSLELLKDLKNLKISILYNLDDRKENHTETIIPVEINYQSDFFMDEICRTISFKIDSCYISE